MKQCSFLLLSLLLACTGGSQQAPTEIVSDEPQVATSAANKVLYNAFSHNDYWREHPLHDALSYGFNCVEADLWPINGEL